MDKILIDDKYSVSFLTDISITNAHTNHIVGILLIFRIFSDQFSSLEDYPLCQNQDILGSSGFSNYI